MILGSGRPYILNEAGIMGRFLKSKMNNCYEHCNALLPTPMQGIHLEKFIEDVCISEEAINNLQQWSLKRTSSASNVKKFWKTVNIVQGGNIEQDQGKNFPILDDLLPDRLSLIHLMQGAIKSIDILFYSYALFQAIQVFFTINNHNMPDGCHFMH